MKNGIYVKEFKVVEEIVKEFSKKAKLGKIPKVTISNDFKLAGVRGLKNELGVGEYLLSQFQKGVFTIEDVKATIAHEIGHLMPSKLPWFQRIFKFTNVVICYIAILTALFFGFFFALPSTFLPFTITLIASLPFLPWAIRKIERPFELEADRNALCLIEKEIMAKSIINKSNQWREYNLGPLKILAELEDILGHPSLRERLDNIGFELKIEIEKKEQMGVS